VASCVRYRHMHHPFCLDEHPDSRWWPAHFAERLCRGESSHTASLSTGLDAKGVQALGAPAGVTCAHALGALGWRGPSDRMSGKSAGEVRGALVPVWRGVRFCAPCPRFPHPRDPPDGPGERRPEHADLHRVRGGSHAAFKPAEGRTHLQPSTLHSDVVGGWAHDSPRRNPHGQLQVCAPRSSEPARNTDTMDGHIQRRSAWHELHGVPETRALASPEHAPPGRRSVGRRACWPRGHAPSQARGFTLTAAARSSSRAPHRPLAHAPEADRSWFALGSWGFPAATSVRCGGFVRAAKCQVLLVCAR
jgi:hypothetical protein